MKGKHNSNNNSCKKNVTIIKDAKKSQIKSTFDTNWIA